MSKDIYEVCQLFLTPATILFAAIGIARTEWLKVLVSLIGTCVGALWFYRVYHWANLPTEDSVMALGLAATFGLAAAASTIVHVVRALRGSDDETVLISRPGS